MRQCALSAAVATATRTGRLHKGSLDLAKLEPAFRGTPVVESHHARVFCAGPLEPNSGITLKNLEIYETNTSSQSQSARFREFSVNRLLLPSDHRSADEFLRRSCGNEVARVPQIKQRIFRH